MQSAPERIEASRRLRLAIGSVGLADEQQNRNVSDLVLAQLTGANGLELVERQALDAVLNELQLSASGLVRAKDAVRAGKLLRADWFLLGTSATVNGTNVAVIRIVDARTGVMRDAAMIPNGETAPVLASGLAAFVRQSRQDAADPKPKTFLAIGSFEDLSVNSRQAAMPRELRSYLTAAYQRGGLAMLEREFVSTLLREVYLDLAGLTEESVTNAPGMQSAYWLVDGSYQSYETTEFEVELVLNVRRMFGRSQRFEMREKPGEPLFRRVKGSIDGAMARDRAALVPTRVTELRAQISGGGELLQSVQNGMAANAFGNWLPYTSDMSASEVARHRRNIHEAVRAFEVALLLDPTNRQAKVDLASCLSTPFAGRYDEARDLYREIIDAPVADRWTADAQAELLWSFERFVSPVEKQRWFESAANRSVNQQAVEFFQRQVKVASEDVILRRRGTSEAEKVAEERLFRDIQAWEREIKNHGVTVDFYNTGLGKYAEAFGTNHAVAARKMVDLLPKLQAASTNLAPHIFAGVVTFQVDTNAPIIAEFERSLEAFSEIRPPYFEHGYYVDLLASPVYRWAEERGLYKLAARLKEIHSQTAARDRGMSVDDEDRVGLAFNYLRAEAWQKALEVFQSYSNRPVFMGNGGLWGPAFTVVLTSKQAALCREKLGLPQMVDPREFDLGEPCLHLHSRNTYYDTLTFVAASDGMWIGLNDHVMRVDFDLQTNFVARVSPNSSAPVAAVCAGTSNVWIGTAGDGLVELDKTTRKTRSFTEKDGLLMDHVSALHLAGDTLWLGYGNESSGGLGRLDLSTRRFTSFTASLSSKPGVTEPPRRKVTEICARPSGDVWFMASSELFRYQPAENTWAAQPNKNSAWVSCYAMDSERLIEALRLTQVELTIEPKTGRNAPTNPVAKITRVVTSEEAAQLQATLKTNGSGLRVSGSRSGSLPYIGGLELRTFRDGRRRRLLDAEKLPDPATALALQGSELWVGGQGFVALVDLDENKIKKLAYVPARTVDQIQTGGGYLWVQFDKHLYRASLRDLH